MNIRVTTVCGVLGAAAVTMWLRSRLRSRRVNTRRGYGVYSTPQIDDDTAADIIRRSLPALEKARRLSFA